MGPGKEEQEAKIHRDQKEGKGKKNARLPASLASGCYFPLILSSVYTSFVFKAFHKESMLCNCFLWEMKQEGREFTDEGNGDSKEVGVVQQGSWARTRASCSVEVTAEHHVCVHACGQRGRLIPDPPTSPSPLRCLTPAPCSGLENAGWVGPLRGLGDRTDISPIVFQNCVSLEHARELANFVLIKLVFLSSSN